MAELSAERRERILRAMARCVVEQGIQGASLRKVAQRTGATTGMITHYYRSKNELIVEALRASSTRFAALMAQVGAKPGLQRLLARFEVRAKSRDPEVPSWEYFMEYWAASMRSEELRGHHVDLSRSGTDRYLEDVRQGIKDGDIDPNVDPETMAYALHALYYGLGVLSTLDPEMFSEGRTLAIFRAATERLLTKHQEA